MPRSLTPSKIDKLGERLAQEHPAQEADLTLLGSLRAEYLPPLLEVVRLVRDRVGVEPSYRLKTNTTIIEKLRRAKTRLSRMQDVGGLRVVVAGGLDQQDQIVERIAALFDQTRIDDRRTRPSAGYRAVHLIVEFDGLPLEIQVRTTLQDLWAQIFERLADFVGRGIRYGEPPIEPDPSNKLQPAHRIVQWVVTISDQMREIEEFRDNLAHVRHQWADLAPSHQVRLDQMKSDVEQYESNIIAILKAVMATLE